MCERKKRRSKVSMCAATLCSRIFLIVISACFRAGLHLGLNGKTTSTGRSTGTKTVFLAKDRRASLQQSSIQAQKQCGAVVGNFQPPLHRGNKFWARVCSTPQAHRLTEKGISRNPFRDRLMRR